MKTSIFLKVFLVLPMILLADYILMILVGCVTCFFGFDEHFFCGTYCIFGKIILGLSVVFFGYIMYPEIVELFKLIKNASSTKK